MKRLLHVGCGYAGRNEVMLEDFRTDEWRHIRLDIDPSVNPDIVDDIRVLKKFDDQSVDGIYSSHNLEHLHYDDAMVAMKTFLRVLRPGGLMFAAVPDFQLACEWIGRGDGLKPIYESPVGPIAPVDMVFGYRPWTRDNQWQMHRCGYTVDIMRAMLKEVGFANVRVTKGNGFDIWAVAERGV